MEFQNQQDPFHVYGNAGDNKMKLKMKFFFLFQLIICACSTPHEWDGIVITQGDYQSLQSLKHDFIDPKGLLKSWNDSGYGACSGSWVGIKCAQGQVIVIQLPWKGLGGRLSENIGQFQALRKLSLHDNYITGLIPTSLGFLPNLRGLQLFNNRFSGSIPASLGLCPLLQTLDFANNSLSGNIPSSLVNSSTKLFRLDLSYNSLTGSIPLTLTRLPSLIYLLLHHNNLSGPIPDDLGKLSRLQTLDLSYNSINGTLPNSLFNLSSLALFNLENNNIHGKIPQSINNLHNLSLLSLRNNHFNGEIPTTIGNISSLKQLDLSYNNLSGQVPASLGDLPNLSMFNVSYNNLSGPVPDTLSLNFNSSSFLGNLKLCGYNGSTTLCPIAPSPGVPQEIEEKHHGKLSTKDIILIAAGALLIVLLILCCILFCCLIRKRGEAAKASSEKKKGIGGTVPDPPPSASATGEIGGKLVHFDGTMGFTADDLLCATAEIMGKSTYGTVYKTTLEDGTQVAVKRLREKISKSIKEFEIEVNLLGKIRHPNLLALRAYYLGPKGEKLLVFDYMPRGPLATSLHARSPGTSMEWSKRMKIIKGMTRGLLHLHTHEKMIHGNLTSSNVLVDEQTNAKVSDYGLSRLMTAAANANVIATAGALGYRAPELSKLNKANTKTDVYSLGVIILELLTGKSPAGGDEAMNGADLPQWVASIVKEEWTNEVFDLELIRNASEIGDELLNTLKLALHCVDPSPSARPEVNLVLQQLDEIRPETAATTSGDEDWAAAASDD